MTIHVSPNSKELSHYTANWIIDYISDVLSRNDRFTIALSGGTTPKQLYQLLASPGYRDKIEWGKLHFFWGDERYVPLTDKDNNAKMAFDELLDHVPVSKDQIHIMRTDIDPTESAVAYEKLLHHYFDGQPYTFDLVLLGLGDNAHTLSLFPGYPQVVHEKKSWVTSFFLKEQNMVRITLTAPVVNAAARLVFLISGDGKARAVREIIQEAYDPDLYPAQVIKPTQGQLFWLLDKAAAMELK